MLYPCSCPIETDGGVGRRATLIKELRQNNPEVLFLDGGAFFAGGRMDEYALKDNPQLEKKRTVINLKAMELMGYDALGLGEDEFNFGSEFLKEQIARFKLNFVSCNVKLGKVKPYIIKRVGKVKVGITGVTPLKVMEKAKAVKFIDPYVAVNQAVKELKDKGANIIILLSQLGEQEDMNLLQRVKGIDFVLVRPQPSENPPEKIGSTVILRPSWQARRLGKLTLDLQDGQIAGYKIEELRVWDKLEDDPKILSFLPACFQDANCKKKGFLGKCLNPGQSNARCEFIEPKKIELTVIAPRQATINFDTTRIEDYLKRFFPGIEVKRLLYPDAPEAEELIKKVNLVTLPIYLLSKEVEKESGFEQVKNNLILKDNFYMLKPNFSGVSFFLKRPRQEGRVDLFLSLYDKNASGVIEALKELKPEIHFLVFEQDGEFFAQRGRPEVEEYLRSVCVRKYYPSNFWDYISCRANKIFSSWWDDCLGSGLDPKKIKTCAQSDEGGSLLRQDNALTRELEVMFGPTYLLHNQEIFGIDGVPTKEEFEKLISQTPSRH